MKTYKPGQVPTSPADVPGFLMREFAAIQQAANRAESFLELQPLATEPARLREGMVAEADGVNWDPGSGAGLYVYRSGAWVFIG